METKITSLTQCLLDILKDNNKYYSSEQNKLLLGNIFAAVNNHDSDLMEILYSNESIRKNFFVKVKDIWIFNDKKFIDFINLKDFMPDSFTSFKNRIGLVDNNGHFLDESNDVVLSFPYKDCVLVGNQDKDDQKRSEVMLNETLGLDDINRLLDPKVLVNAKRYSSQGVEQNISFNEKDNLIIKGNNLIALSSILKRYEGKVKCIYIDPPYNTGNDSFKYNDKFNHSTWLVFMKNRLELAKKLLRDDGVIFVQCDRNEYAYLKVLMDSIFGRINELSTIIWLNKEGGGKSDSKFFRQKHEYILCFCNDKNYAKIIPQDVEDIERYTKVDEFEHIRGKYQLVKLDSGSLEWSQSLDYPIEYDGKTYYAGGDKDKWEDRQKGGASVKDWGWRWGKEKLEWGIENKFVVFKNSQIYTKQYLNCDKDGNIVSRTNQPIPVIEKYSNTKSNKHMKKLFNKVPFNYSKPEGIVMEILKWVTSPNDIVLDFFLGSGTTAAVAHKMNRQYIGIEQMDYIEDISVERLKKVIDGEQGGISKLVGWQSGGSFVYCELAQNTQKWVDLVKKATDCNIVDIKNQILNSDDIIPYLSKEEIESTLSTFDSLSLDEQKARLISIINKNKLYVDYSQIDDESYGISEADKQFSKSFYEVENE
ncbi:site-specific DNA-methyltransferase [Mycoplasmopsis mucosicanis]|uniref:Site-specific DNA-methyltransferase n=1 Tax=Mycoplasmopsis mucosicanis TaxID=458208 RepID=A0A507SVM1_9BACT|nr:site-specific DNA-methyltransferase [Mycoplasmopsis mucosicanis]TQC54234.1 site-specific DNA-methyltransferase [Mycoplasmopsis mucosicanis]